MDRMARILFSAVLFLAVVMVAGCKKTAAPPPAATAPPPAPAPTASLEASPGTVTAGDNVVLTWNTSNATSVSIEGLGEVTTSGSKTVSPSETTSYHLTAQGAGGSVKADATVTVNPAKVAEAPPPPKVSLEDEFKNSVQDVFFDYDKFELRIDAQPVVQQDLAFLTNHPDVKIVIGGYCDERGSDEYNLALGQNRATAVRKALVNGLVPEDRIRIVSYGKEKPFCTDSTESCWQQNRRAGFSLDR